MTKEEVLAMLNESPENLQRTESHEECIEYEDYISENIIPLDKKIIVEQEGFKIGILSVMELCGAITALVNVGITPSKAMDYLIEKEAAKEAMAHNIQMAHIQADAVVEGAKYENVVNQKNML